MKPVFHYTSSRPTKRGLYRFFHAPDKEDQAQHESALKTALTSVRLLARRNLRKNFIDGQPNMIAIGKVSDAYYHYLIENDRWIPYNNSKYDAVVPNMYNTRLELGIPMDEPEGLFVILLQRGKFTYKVLDVANREFIYMETEKGKGC
uniref:DUF3825 domain-containing protein n=1 Tax=Panagrellus redivivus TaxID=6233 RepID=A0A7E4UUD9_PANRE